MSSRVLVPEFVADTTPPTVTITAPSVNLFANSRTVLVAGKAVDDSGGSGVASVSVNSLPANYDSGTNLFFAIVPALADGPFTISVTATDVAGNISAPATITITIDTIPPTLTIDSPAVASVTGDTVTVTGTFSDGGSGISQVAVNDVAATISGNSYSAVLGNLCNGPLHVTALAFDKAGNNTVLTRNVTVAAATPQLCWNHTGPEGGNIVAVVTDPTNAKTIYTASNNGRVFKSTDAGVTWLLTSNGLPGSPLQGLVVTGTNPVSLFVLNFNAIYKSTNGGLTWTLSSNGLSGIFLNSLSTDPTNPNQLYAGTTKGVYKTSDGGANWVPSNIGINFLITTVTVDPTNSAIIYAGTSKGVFRSVDGGTSWQLRNTGLAPSISIQSLVVDPTNDNIVYVGSSFGVFKSLDAGANWSKANSGLPQSNAATLWPDPVNPNTIYAGVFGGLYRSANAGESWSAFNSNLPAPLSINNLAFDISQPPTFYAATNVGLFKSSDGGSTWSFVNKALFGTIVSAIAVDPTNSQIIYAATNGGFGTDGGVYKSLDGGSTWQSASAGLSGVTVNLLTFDPLNPNTLYAGTSVWMYRTTNGGASWSLVGTNLAPGARFLSFDQIQTIAFDPFNAGTIYAGDVQDLFKSVDGGNSWAPINLNFSGHFPNVTAVVFNPTMANTIYIAAGGAVYKSTDAGVSWLSPFPFPLNGSSITSLIIDVGNPGTLYAATAKGVLKSIDGGTTWAASNNGVPAGNPILFLAQDPNNPLVLYGASKAVVFKSIDGGSNWASISSNGLPGRFVDFARAFAINPININALYYGTNGGMFTLQQPIDPNEPVPAITSLGQTSIPVRTPGLSLAITGSNFVTGSKVLWNNAPRGVQFVSNTQLMFSLTAADLASPGANSIQIANPGGYQSSIQTVTVSKLDQTITFAAIPDQTVSNAHLSVSASASSNLPVDLSVVSGPATIAGNTVTLLGVGTVVIEARQAGNDTYNPAIPVQRTFAVNNSMLSVSKLSPSFIIAGQGDLTLTVQGSGFMPGSIVSLNNISYSTTFVSSTQLTVVIPGASLVAGSQGILTVANPAPSNGLSNAVKVNIVSLIAKQSSSAPIGASVSNSLPSSSTQPGLTAVLHNNGGTPATLSLASYANNPVSGGVVDVGGGFVDLQVLGADGSSTVQASFYYPTSITGLAESQLRLMYFDGGSWRRVMSSGGGDPLKDTTDNLDGTVSGGRFNVVFDQTSKPSISQLTGTVFTMTSGVYGDINDDGTIDAADLVLLANVLAGNVQITTAAADVFQDGNINAADLVTLANYLAGNIAALPVVPNQAATPVTEAGKPRLVHQMGSIVGRQAVSGSISK